MTLYWPGSAEADEAHCPQRTLLTGLRAEPSPCCRHSRCPHASRRPVPSTADLASVTYTVLRAVTQLLYVPHGAPWNSGVTPCQGIPRALTAALLRWTGQEAYVSEKQVGFVETCTNCYVLFLSCLPSSRPTRPWGDGRGSRLFQELADFHTAVILWEHFLPAGGGRKLIPVTGKMTHHSLAGFPGAASQQQGQSCARWVTLPSLPPAAGILAPLLPYSLTSKEALWREVSAQRAPGPGPGQSSPVAALAPGLSTVPTVTAPCPP